MTASDPFRFVGNVTWILRKLLEHIYYRTRINGMGHVWIGQGLNRGNPPEHSTGRAADIIIASAVGLHPTAVQKANGWVIARYLMKHARTLNIAWIIWDGRIWNPSRDRYNVWRTYTGGYGVSGGHYDHIHVMLSNGSGKIPNDVIPMAAGAPVSPPVAKPTPDLPNTGGSTSNFPGAWAFKYGAQNDSVIYVNQRLRAHGHNPGTPDSIWGHGSINAMKAFQKAKGNVGSGVDGVPGPQDWAALSKAPAAKPAPSKPAPVAPPKPARKPKELGKVSIGRLKWAKDRDPQAKGTPLGQYADDVYTLELALNRTGWLAQAQVDGHYGTATVDACKGFQRKHSSARNPDGVLGRKELTRLFELARTPKTIHN